MTEDLQPHGRVRHSFFLFSKVEKSIINQIIFVLGIGIGLLIVHELGHLFFHFLFPRSWITELVIFPFITKDWNNVIFAWEVSFIAEDAIIVDAGDFLFPFLFQIIYLFLLRKKFTPMEFILWAFISLLYLHGDFLAMCVSFKNGL